MSISVLVVDDDFRVAGVHAEFISAIDGMTVVGTAHTAAGALAAARERRPQLVLLDNYLPDRIGVDVIGPLTALRCDVIMVTADGSAETVHTALARGALNYLVKPFTAQQLAARLNAYRRFRHRLASGVLVQEQIDEALALLHAANRPPTPKGRSPVTARLVRVALQRSDRARTAADLATELGIARATTQRYLAALVEEGVAEMRLRYGSTGRPEHEYRWR